MLQFEPDDSEAMAYTLHKAVKKSGFPRVNAGVTEFFASIYGPTPQERAATCELLAQCARG